MLPAVNIVAALRRTYPGRTIRSDSRHGIDSFIVIHPFVNEADLVVYVCREGAGWISNFGSEEFKSDSEMPVKRPIKTVEDALKAVAEVIEDRRRDRRTFFDEGMAALRGTYPPSQMTELSQLNAEMCGERELL